MSDREDEIRRHLNRDQQKAMTAIPPAAATGPLIVAMEVVDIVGASIRSDHQAVAVKLQLADGNRAVMGLSPGGVDAMIESLTKIRAELTANGIEPTISYSPVHTFLTGVHTHDDTAFVSLIFDRSLQSAKAYLMPPKSARLIAKQLVTAARYASSARGEAVEPDPEGACPGHVASSDNPKICGRCGAHIDGLRPLEN